MKTVFNGFAVLAAIAAIGAAANVAAQSYYMRQRLAGIDTRAPSTCPVAFVQNTRIGVPRPSSTYLGTIPMTDPDPLYAVGRMCTTNGATTGAHCVGIGNGTYYQVSIAKTGNLTYGAATTDPTTIGGDCL